MKIERQQGSGTGQAKSDHEQDGMGPSLSYVLKMHLTLPYQNAMCRMPIPNQARTTPPAEKLQDVKNHVS